jgi:hypothetical protein
MLKGSSLCLYSSNLELEKRGRKLKKNLLLWNYWANLNQTLLRWSLDGPLSNCVRQPRPVSKMAAITKNRNFYLTGDHLRIISAKFGWDWLSSFRGEDFFLISSPFFLICIIKLVKRGEEIKKIFYSETTEPISTKLCWNDP